MTPQEFINAYYGYAKKSEEKSGISAIATLSIAALESGWGKKAPGNNFFGIKDTDGVNGNEQLVETTEYLKTDTVKFPKIISIVFDAVKKLYKYRVLAYFRKYNDAEDAFNQHAQFFLKNKRYAEALKVKSDPYRFIEEIAKAGYATSPTYADLLKGVARRIEALIPKE
jgi:flagellum-specific peptidoglycan hydrolase FlgJ